MAKDMRSMLKTNLSFGLINIPVGVYKATEEDKPAFHLHHNDPSCLAPIHFVKVCENGHTCTQEDIVKGMNWEGTLVTMDESDFAKVETNTNKTITMLLFCDPDEVPIEFYSQPYFLGPDKDSHAYSLLVAALQATNKVGIAKFAFRQREHLCVITTHDNHLMMNEIRFGSEIRDASTIRLPTQAYTSEELELACSLVEQLSSEFDAANYTNGYAAALTAVIAAKAAGTPLVVHETEPVKVPDLMAALKQSLKTVKSKVS